MDCCALDLGTKTGYAYNRGDKFFAGTWELASAKEIAAWGKVRLTRRKDPRVERLCEKIEALGHFDILVYEDVEFIQYRKQGQLWPALRSALWLCGDADHFDCVSVKTLKKFATGDGNADKEAMLVALEKLHLDLWLLGCYDDNAVDAIWLWLWAKQNLERTKKQ